VKGYNVADLYSAYEAVGVTRGSTVSLKTDLRLLGPYSGEGSPLEAHFRVLAELIDLKRGTLVVTTANTSLCNTDTVFDPATTPSAMGVLSEFIRHQPGAVRSFHPFLSYTAVGREARELCLDVSRHGFGPESPKARLLERDTLVVSLGQHVRLTASVLHHAEMLMGVPYRYTKEFMHPVQRPSGVKIEPFYMFVWYRECGIDHDGVEKIFNFYTRAGGTMREVELGRGRIYSVPLRPYFESNLLALKEDPYMFLKQVPEAKPYRR